jgi:Domain of unknown function (DUF6250)
MGEPAAMMIAKMPPASRLILALAMVTAAAQTPGKRLFSDDFTRGLSPFIWTVELEKGGSVDAKGGILSLDVPAGCTVWFRQELRGPVVIEYEATMIQRGGPNDRVSDLNCFWMARDARVNRSGKFADYNTLRGYYVGQGGNTNTTTRFRRYIGDPVLRPLLPEHDLKAPLLEPNTPMKIRLLADGSHIQYSYDGRVVFDFRDPEPYTRGWFGFRTTFSHIEIRNFRVTRP